MTVLPFSGHGISLGGLQLVDWGQPVTYDGGYTFEVSADGTTWGNPAIVVSTLISALSDGDVVEQQRAGNREPVLFVRIVGDSHRGLIAGDTALSAVVGKACELVWQPPDPDAPPTVIDVVHSRMEHAWDDLDALRFERVWTITMSALPWPRSATKVLTPAIASAGPTVVDNGSSTSGWVSPGTLSVVSGAVTSTYDPRVALYSGFAGTSLKRIGSIDTSVNKYIAVDYKASTPGFFAFREDGAAANLSEVKREPLANGFTRSWYQVGASQNSLANIYLDILHPTSSATTATLAIDQVQVSSTLSPSGTTRQLTRSITPSGNVPAEGDIIVEHPTSALGRTIVFSHPAGSGYTPALRQWRSSSSGPIANASMVSGFYDDLTAPMVYSIPISAIPESGAQLWIKCGASSTSAVRINWSATSVQGGVVQVNSRQSGNTLISVPSVGPHYLFPIGNVTLPPSRVADSGSGYVSIIIERDSSSAATNVTLDEAWIFATDRGRLTVIDCGDNPAATGASGSRLRISAPSLARPYGELQVATRADFSDSWEPNGDNVLCDQTGHKFDPETGSVIFTVTVGATDAAVSLEHYPRWRAEAGD